VRLNGKLLFNGRELELFINDRLLAPNTDVTRRAAEPELRDFFGKLFRGANYSLAFESEPRKLFSATVRSETPFTVAELLANLDS
jgi:hypothetical protein